MKRELAAKRQKVSDLKGTITNATSKCKHSRHSLTTKNGDISSEKSKSKTDKQEQTNGKK